jgi:hypothetical protein
MLREAKRQNGRRPVIQEQLAWVENLHRRLALALQEAVARDAARSMLRESRWNPLEIEMFAAWGWSLARPLITWAQYVERVPPNGKGGWLRGLQHGPYEMCKKGRWCDHAVCDSAGRALGLWICEHGMGCESCAQSGSRTLLYPGDRGLGPDKWDCAHELEWLIDHFLPLSGAWAGALSTVLPLHDKLRSRCHWLARSRVYHDNSYCRYDNLVLRSIWLEDSGVDCNSVSVQQISSWLHQRLARAKVIEQTLATSLVRSFTPWTGYTRIGPGRSFRIDADWAGGSTNV